jgi:hypothetical protein
MNLSNLLEFYLLFILVSVMASGGSSSIDQLKSMDELLQKVNFLEMKVATLELTGNASMHE